MSVNSILEKTELYVKQQLENIESGHDWWHAHRVRNNALQIQQIEGGDALVVELSCLVHDVIDSKFFNADKAIIQLKQFFSTCGVDNVMIEMIVYIISNISFSKEITSEIIEKNIELQVVQDADRLDAIGAIGIARAFSYGGANNRAMFVPGDDPLNYTTSEEYRKSKSHTVNHFYEKLFHLKDKMNTACGRKLAEERDAYMRDFLNKFYDEWGVKIDL